ncbi:MULTISPECIES: winged helix-turn-helix domain-containing protein [Protofrankia]|uniref:Two component transcriptional regulator, winged helix family n=1 Tax=Candidatus Protofrankia datiscae TaxID=2716812 RepID=F8B3T3_9ACTN|nr:MULTISPECIES: response regulator transcription factor [Protofrankia]AEH09028.1 two component transcriptional regulator, winged helix family [Candidatus Protofrankia datiscae]
MRLLVVEDETRAAALPRRGLVEEGFAVDIGSDGVDAVWQAGEVAYYVIVLDLMLPGIDGFEVRRRLRADGRWAPVLMLTARGEIADRIRGLNVGADDYLPKPFSFGELVARLRLRVRLLMRRGAVARPAVLEVGGLRLDLAARTASRDETPLDLSSKEFALLEYLVRHPGEVLTRTVIMEYVWDFASDATSNVVDQYVTYLRRKIDKSFGVPQVEMVRGVGYRLRADTGQQRLG